jgi:hypothetical protein
MTCASAFDQAKIGTVCHEKEEIINPFCGHSFLAECHEKEHLVESQRNRSFVAVTAPVEIVDESNLLASFPTTPSISISCNHQVKFRRKCGHEILVSCDKARNPHKLGPCKEKVNLVSPLCGHELEMECSAKDTIKNPFPTTFVSSAAWNLLMHDGILEDTVPPPTNLQSSLSTCQKQLTLRKTSSCGHDVTLRCCDAWNQLKKTSQASCKQLVVKALVCGHEKEFECSKYDEYLNDPSQILCEEEIQKKCWNFQACHQRIPLPCSSQEFPCCQSRSQWTCPAGLHSFDIPVCSMGQPSHCPDCILEEVQREIAVIEEFQKNGEFPPLDFEKLPAVFDGLRNQMSCIQHKDDTLIRSRFYTSKARVLSSYLTFLEKLDPWKRQVFQPRLIPFYINISGHRNDFDPSNAEKLTTQSRMFGVRGMEFTLTNLKSFLDSSSKGKKQKRPLTTTLALGWAYSCKMLVEDDALSKKPHNEFRKLFTKSRTGYDSLQLFNSEAYIFLDPYCLFFSHTITFTGKQLKDLVNDLAAVPASPRTFLLHKTITFSRPDSQYSPNSSAEAREFSTKVSQVKETLAGIEELEGINISMFWDAVSLSLHPNSFSESVDQELKKKVNFIAGRRGTNPFSGVKYLKSLISNSAEHEDLKLILCLEFLHLGVTTLPDAQRTFDEYLKFLKQTCSDAHPLLMVAASRLFSTASKRIVAKRLIKAFVLLHPKAKSWLTESELEYLNDRPSAAKKSVSSSAPLPPREQWEQLKQTEGCSSKALEELLDMTGLKKVKRFAIEMFTTAIALQKMPKSRGNNYVTLNYSFHGNPGSGKTTVARLFARILHDSGMRSKDTFVECSAQKLKDDGPDEFRKLVAQAKDGVLFIDEAYDLGGSCFFNVFHRRPLITKTVFRSKG